jgi:ATP-dependent RNA helicase DDX27
VVKAAVKSARTQGAKVVSRQIPNDEAEAWVEKLKNMETEIEEVLKEEKEERVLSITERELKRGENLVHHESEIMARPRRTWFETEKDKKASREKGATELNGEGRIKAKKKMSGKDRKKLELNDVRKEGTPWKKGSAERAGKGALEKTEWKGKKGKGGKPDVKSKGKPRIGKPRK